MTILSPDGKFEGSVRRVEAYDYVLSGDNKIAVLENKNLQRPPTISFDFYDSSASVYVKPSQYCISCSSEQGTVILHQVSLYSKKNF